MELGYVAPEALHHATRRHLISKIHGTGETRGIGSTVALDGDAVEPKEDAAIQLARIHLFLECAKCALGQDRAEASQERPPHGGT